MRAEAQINRLSTLRLWLLEALGTVIIDICGLQMFDDHVIENNIYDTKFEVNDLTWYEKDYGRRSIIKPSL